MSRNKKVLIASGVGTVVVLVFGRRLVLATVGGALTAAGAWLLSRGFNQKAKRSLT